MSALASLVIWGGILYLIVRLVLRKMKGNRATASATATAEGGEATSGARADVGGIHIHLHIGDGQSLSVVGAGNDDDHFVINPAELLGARPVDSDGIRQLPNGIGSDENASGNPARALSAGAPVRRPRRHQPLAVNE